MAAKQFWKGVWEELNGTADHRRLAERVGREVTDQTLREVVRLIRRYYQQHHDPNASTDYDRGYGDAILDMTRLLDPDVKDS